MRFTFSNFLRDMTYNYYLKQKITKCEVILNQILAIDPRLAYHLNSFSSKQYTRNYTNQEIFLSTKGIQNKR